MKHEPKAKVKPWPGSTFALKTEWEDGGLSRHFRVYLERRAPGKFGRMHAMDAIVPTRRRKDDVDAMFSSSRYRRGTLDATRELFRQVGVPEDQADGFMRAITKEFPYPTAKESFEDELASPMLTMALGVRRKELSYYRTGVPELTADDQLLIKRCMVEFETRVLKDPAEGRKFLNFVLGGKL
jgi:hypothetical protein